jgi:hypothetical protein
MRSYATLFAAVVLGFIGVIWTVLFNFGWFPGILGVVILVVSVALVIIWALARQRTVVEWAAGWSHPTLEITPWPLDLGTLATVVYRRRPRRAGALATRSGALQVEAATICTEWVRYTVGTNTRTETNRVVDIRSCVPAQCVGEEIVATCQIAIPTDAGGPTLALSNNRVTWTLEHKLGDPYGARTRTRAGVVVRPVLDRDIATGERRLGAAAR